MISAFYNGTSGSDMEIIADEKVTQLPMSVKTGDIVYEYDNRTNKYDALDVPEIEHEGVTNTSVSCSDITSDGTRIIVGFTGVKGFHIYDFNEETKEYDYTGIIDPTYTPGTYTNCSITNNKKYVLITDYGSYSPIKVLMLDESGNYNQVYFYSPNMGIMSSTFVTDDGAFLILNGSAKRTVLYYKTGEATWSSSSGSETVGSHDIQYNKRKTIGTGTKPTSTPVYMIASGPASPYLSVLSYYPDNTSGTSVVAHGITFDREVRTAKFSPDYSHMAVVFASSSTFRMFKVPLNSYTGFIEANNFVEITAPKLEDLGFSGGITSIEWNADGDILFVYFSTGNNTQNIGLFKRNGDSYEPIDPETYPELVFSNHQYLRKITSCSCNPNLDIMVTYKATNIFKPAVWVRNTDKQYTLTPMQQNTNDTTEYNVMIAQSSSDANTDTNVYNIPVVKKQ